MLLYLSLILSAMLDVLMSQTCPKIIVGDPNQQIYAFRGAINALKNVASTHTYYLTQVSKTRLNPGMKFFHFVDEWLLGYFKCQIHVGEVCINFII